MPDWSYVNICEVLSCVNALLKPKCGLRTLGIAFSLFVEFNISVLFCNVQLMNKNLRNSCSIQGCEAWKYYESAVTRV